jgi:hypothetical protein
MALFVMGFVITLATGELHTTGWGYGVPLPWKTDPAADCPSPFSSGPCPLIVNGSFVYNWFFFVLDVLFYMAIGYGLLLAFRKFKQPSPSSPGA